MGFHTPHTLSEHPGLVFGYTYVDPLLDRASAQTDVDPAARLLGGHVLDHLYQDVGDRQQLLQLLQDCTTQLPVQLIIRRWLELGDSVLEISDRLATLEHLQVRLIVLESAQKDTDSQPAIQTPELLSFFQSLQESQQSRRIRRGHALNRIKTLPPPGKAPYGYRRGKDRYLVDRTTAPVVKDFVDHFLLYGTLRGSVRYLQKKYNKRISVSTGKRWLSSPVYRGDLMYHTGEVIADTHVAIISRQEAAQVDRLLRRNRQLPPRTATAPRSLAGLVRCSICHSPMTVSRVTAARKTRDYLYLRPQTCPNQPKCRAIAYDQILEQVIQRICEDLPQAVAALHSPDVEQIKQGIRAQITAKQSILDQLPGLVSTGILDQATADLRTYTLRAEQAALQGRLEQLPPVNLKAIAQTVSIPQFWLDLSESERRFYFREFIRHIEIMRQERTWQVRLVFMFD
jgi:DNA invertase Pin-like site-specific DNA recombinase